MTSDRVVEFISHFAGHFHIIEEASRIRVDYDDFVVGRLIEDFDPAALAGLAQKHDFDEFPTLARFVPFSPQPTDLFGSVDLQPRNGDAPRRPDEPRDLLVDVRAMMPPSPALAATAGSYIPVITVTYFDGGDQVVFQVDQQNHLIDNDWWFPHLGVEQVDTLAVLDDMSKQADHEVSGAFGINTYDSQSLIDFADARDAQTKASHGGKAGNLEPGVYVNEVLQPEDAVLPSRPEATDGEPDSGLPAQILVAGGNNAVNAAIILDSNHAQGTLIVIGDYFKTDAIIQVNFHIDDDELALPAYYDLNHASQDCEAFNVAQFLKTDPGFQVPEGVQLFAGLTWHVDVFSGDLYDIQSITQTIWMSDNDLTLQDNYHSHQQLVVGANEQTNMVEFLNLTQTYDLVIVLGDHHDINLIYQKNILLDPDILKLPGLPGVALDAEGQGPTISTGGNWLLNEAVIENYTTQNYLSITPELAALIDKLNSQDGELELPAGNGLVNLGDATFDILIVTGDMYDINAIAQTNVIADVDIAIQLVPDAVSQSSIEMLQQATTGDNALTNFAAIVDTGPAYEHYVGGNIYEDEILIQAEIIASENDNIIVQDPGVLASELVAFTSTDEREDGSADSQLSSGTYDQGQDVLGGILA